MVAEIQFSRKELQKQFFFADNMVGMAQLVSAPDCGSGGRGFESHYPPFLLWVTSSVGRALDF